MNQRQIGNLFYQKSVSGGEKRAGAMEEKKRRIKNKDGIFIGKLQK